MQGALKPTSQPPVPPGSRCLSSRRPQKNVKLNMCQSELTMSSPHPVPPCPPHHTGPHPNLPMSGGQVNQKPGTTSYHLPLSHCSRGNLCQVPQVSPPRSLLDPLAIAPFCPHPSLVTSSGLGLGSWCSLAHPAARQGFPHTSLSCHALAKTSLMLSEVSGER